MKDLPPNRRHKFKDAQCARQNFYVWRAIARKTNTGGDCGSTKWGAIGFHAVVVRRKAAYERLEIKE